MNKKFFYLAAAITMALILISGVTLAAEPFYEGKVIRTIVGYGAGGGMDIYARIMARHLGKHIPGNPTIIVENMPGAGALICANYLYNIAKPDGLNIGLFAGGLFFNKVLGQEGGKFDIQKFEFIGSPAPSSAVGVLSKVSGINSIEKWLASKKPLKIGGVGPGAPTTDITPLILKVAIGLPMLHLSGYKGTAELRLAVDSGELDGCFIGEESISGVWYRAVEKGDVFVVLQAHPKPWPGLQNVPLAINFAKTEEARQLIEVGIHTNLIITRLFVLPPGTHKEQVQILRNAFLETLKDKDFLKEAEKAKLYIDPITGDEVEKAVARILKLGSDLIAKFKEILVIK